jgi:tetratricopeptide (TPR) repeat protein/predicted Ser/Thr protein kinase
VIGTHIGHYRVLERVGEGGMGEVYLVEDTRLHRRAALKLISPTLTRDETRRQRFVQEARLAASIDHPHIAAIHEVGEHDGRTFLVMEYVEGRSLRQVLQAGPLKLRQALDYAIEAGDALVKVHERGVIHRDLKPENLLIAHDGYLKIIDFGLAKLADPLAQSGLADAVTISDDPVRTADGVVLGTVGYMSPEQVRGEVVDARSDIFSFGAVLYEMVTGRAPFWKKSAAETISAVLGEMPAAPQVDDLTAASELQRIVRKCLAKEAGSRYQGMRDLLVDLRDLRNTLASAESVARGPHLVTALTTRVRRPHALAVAGLTIVVIAAALAWVASRRPAGSDGAAAAAPARPAVAIVPFEVMGGNPDAAWLGKGLPSMLITGLAQTPDIEVIGNERLSDAARQLGAAGLDVVDRGQLADLARRSGARFVLVGSIVQVGRDLRIDARVEDLETGAVRLAESVRGADALTLADDLAARVRRGLDVRATPGAVRPVAEMSTASVDAYRAYLAGADAWFNYRLADARRHFQEAIALDPGFGLAYFHLSGVADFQGRVSESREWLQRAAAHLDRMPERDATLVRANLARAGGRNEESEQLLEDLVARYPDTETAWITLGFSVFASDVPRALTLFERATAALPHSAGLRNMLGYAQVINGRYDEGLRSFEAYVNMRPSEANTLDSLAEGQLVAGRVADALATFDAAIKRGYVGGSGGQTLVLAVLGRYDEALREPARVGNVLRALLLSRLGRYAEALDALAAARRVYEANGWQEGMASIDLTRAAYALERGRCPETARDVAQAEASLASTLPASAAPWLVYADLLAGVCAARDGRHDEAQRRVDHARQIHRAKAPLEAWWLAVLEAEVLFARGDPDGALRAFTAGLPSHRMFFNRHLYFFTHSILANNLILRDLPARVAAAQGQTGDAIALYRGLLTSGPDQPYTAALEPRYVLALAQQLEKARDTEAARAEYRRFLDLWKGADTDLPDIGVARAALTR